MSSVSKNSKKRLNSIIDEISKTPEKFTVNPEKDFTRNRKLPLKTTISLILAMGGKSLPIEMLEFFNYSEATATSSAFVQARGKILPMTFHTIFEKFTLLSKKVKKFRGYRILAHDGSDVNLPKNTDDSETYQGNGVNLFHLNAFYDVLNKIYVNADLQGKCKVDERASLIAMINNSSFDDKTIILGDRGYESCNLFVHLQNKGYSFVIRAKDVHSNGLLANLNLPQSDTFDVDVKFWLTRLQTKAIKANPNFKSLSTSSKFDFLPPKSKDAYEMNFRVVRLKLGENSYETLITNLNQDEFSSADLKELYKIRWGIETSFRELKYAIGLCHLHAKTKSFIEQEIFSRLIMYNFCMIITCQVAWCKKPTKLGYQANFTVAIQICRTFFSHDGESPPNVEALIAKHLLPIRKNRKNKRKLTPKSFVSFLYRV